MKIKVLFVEDVTVLFENQMHDIGRIFSNYIRINRLEDVISWDEENRKLTIGENEFYFRNKEIVIKNTEKRPTSEEEIQSKANIALENLKMLEDNLMADKVVLLVDLCLHKDEIAPFSFFNRILENEEVSNLMITTGWVSVADSYEQGYTDFSGINGKFYFYRRAINPITQKMMWTATDDGSYKYKDEIEEINENYLRDMIFGLIAKDNINLKYIATILLCAGLSIN